MSPWGALFSSVLAASAASGCSLLFSPIPQDDPDAAAAQADAAAADARPAVVCDHTLPQVPVDRDLVVRYFIDEPDGSVVLCDSAAGAPFHLGLLYGSSLTFFGAPGDKRALEWAPGNDRAGAIAPVDGSKLDAELDGATEVTLELVLDAHTEAQNVRRIFWLGPVRTRWADLSLDLNGTVTEITVNRQDENNGDVVARWPDSIADQDRIVVHLVLDWTREISEQIHLYVNGAPVTEPSKLSELPDEALAIGPGASLVLGNRTDLDRSMTGLFHYAAVYAAALEPAEIVANAERLSACDDRHCPLLGPAGARARPGSGPGE